MMSFVYHLLLRGQRRDDTSSNSSGTVWAILAIRSVTISYTPNTRSSSQAEDARVNNALSRRGEGRPERWVEGAKYRRSNTRVCERPSSPAAASSVCRRASFYIPTRFCARFPFSRPSPKDQPTLPGKRANNYLTVSSLPKRAALVVYLMFSSLKGLETRPRERADY